MIKRELVFHATPDYIRGSKEYRHKILGQSRKERLEIISEIKERPKGEIIEIDPNSLSLEDIEYLLKL